MDEGYVNMDSREALAAMRKRWTRLDNSVRAVKMRLDARGHTAQEIAKDYRDALLQGLDTEELRCELEALERSHQKDLAELEVVKESLMRTEGYIANIYRRAMTSDATVDWKPVLIADKRAIFHGWDRSTSAGEKLCTETELIPPEMKELRAIIAEKGRTRYPQVQLAADEQGGYRIQVLYATYRGMCHTDYDGRELLGYLLPLFGEDGEALEDGLQYLDNLVVLRGYK